MNRILSFFILIILINCSNKNSSKKDNNSHVLNSNQKNNLIPVSTLVISDNNFFKQIIINGKVESKEKINLHCKMSNRIKKINIKNGQPVNINQLLCYLENDIIKNQLTKAKIKLEEAKINYSKNKLSSKTLRKLELKSGVLEAKNNLERNQINYKQTLLKAPFSGLIANLEKKKGDFITSSEVFCTIINPNDLEFSFSVLENEYKFINKGQEIEIHHFADKKNIFKGIISEINPIVGKNGLIKVKAKITSKDSGLLDGANVKGYINKQIQDVIVIPKEALVLRSNRDVVFTIEKGLAKWNYVDIVGENSNSYAIKKGLKVTDTIIVTGNLNLAHDAKVNATFVNNDTTSK